MDTFSIRTQTFRLGLADYLALWLSPRMIAPAIGGYIGALLALPLTVGLSDLERGNAATCLLVAAAVLAYALVSFTVGLLVLWLRYRRNAMMTGDRIMILDSSAVRLIGPGFDIRQPWRNFAGLYKGRRHVFLLMHTSRAYVIPNIALGTGDLDRLVTRARAALGKDSAAPAVLPPLAENPDNREIWPSRPYRTTMNLIFPRLSKLIWPAILVLAGTACISLAAAAWTGHHGLWHEGSGLIASFAIVMLIATSMLPVAGRLIAQRLHFQGERTFSFTRDYIRATAPTFDGRYDWDNVRDVRSISGVFIFRLASGRFTVPASAFATKAQAMAFYSQAVAFWRAAEARRELHP